MWFHVKCLVLYLVVFFHFVSRTLDVFAEMTSPWSIYMFIGVNGIMAGLTSFLLGLLIWLLSDIFTFKKRR